MAKNEVTTKQETEVTVFVADAPAFVKKGNRGSEEVGTRDMILPRIDVLQDLSPQLKKAKPEYIEGAEAGMLYNTVTNELYKSVVFVPCAFRKEYVVWKDRKKGGGFGGAFKTEELANAEIAGLDNPADYEAIETHQHFGMIVDVETKARKQVVLSMSRSKLRVSRKLNSLVQMSESDRWAKAYKVLPVADTSDQGDFYNISVSPLGWVDEETYKAGEKLYEIVKAGQADVVRDEQSHTADAKPASANVADL